jgi:hypothetical protein
MAAGEETLRGVIWATRGRHWGFRFLLRGGLKDPLPLYESVFVGLGSEVRTWRLKGEVGAVRFTDPEGRRDRSGRTIQHDFVVPEALSSSIHSPDEGVERLWPLVSAAYSRVWSLERPPTAVDLAL